MRVRMRQRRKELNLTQEQVAKMAGKSRTWYTKVETGKRGLKLDDMYRISKALGVYFDGNFFENICDKKSQKTREEDQK